MKRHFLISLCFITASFSGEVDAKVDVEKIKDISTKVAAKWNQFVDVDIDYNRLSCQKPGAFFEALLSRVEPSKLQKCFENGYRLMRSHNTSLRKEYDRMQGLYGETFIKLLDLYIYLQFGKGERPHFDNDRVGFEKITKTHLEDLRSVLRAFVLPDPRPSKTGWKNVEACFHNSFIGKHAYPGPDQYNQSEKALRITELGQEISADIKLYNAESKSSDKEKATELLHTIVKKLEERLQLAKELNHERIIPKLEEELETYKNLLAN